MPIRPEQRALYPKDWPAISRRIRARAEGRCECHGECGRDHNGRCRAANGEPHPETLSRVVLTTAHLDHAPANCADDNLKAMCQRCHLAYDHKHHQANARETRRKRKEIGDLLAAELEKSP